MENRREKECFERAKANLERTSEALKNLIKEKCGINQELSIVGVLQENYFSLSIPIDKMIDLTKESFVVREIWNDLGISDCAIHVESNFFSAEEKQLEFACSIEFESSKRFANNIPLFDLLFNWEKGEWFVVEDVQNG